eukprot:scaffold9442_cov117-Isochrysis_galbana.AAC.13
MLFGEWRWSARAASRAVRGGVFSASVEDGEVVGGGDCSFEQLVSAARVESRTDVVSRQHVTAVVDSCQYGTESLFSAPFGCNCGCAATLWLLRRRSPGVYSLTTPTHRGGVMCKALWQALAGSLSRYFVVQTRISSIAGSNGAALWLTLLSCAGSRGRFGDEVISMTVSFGAEAEGAARASAGRCSMRT